MVRPQGQLLVCERWSIPGAWQFPQGGVDDGETLEQALFREVGWVPVAGRTRQQVEEELTARYAEHFADAGPVYVLVKSAR